MIDGFYELMFSALNILLVIAFYTLVIFKAFNYNELEFNTDINLTSVFFLVTFFISINRFFILKSYGKEMSALNKLTSKIFWLLCCIFMISNFLF